MITATRLLVPMGTVLLVTMILITINSLAYIHGCLFYIRQVDTSITMRRRPYADKN